MTLTVQLPSHPLLDAGLFAIELSHALVDTPTPPTIRALAQPGASAHLQPSDVIKNAVRDLLRHGGYKPSGRSKPASEYLVAACADGRFPTINALVDACNVVSLHSGLPISLVDLDRTEGTLSIQIAPAGTTYVFNAAGQVIDVSGLVCLYDAVGPTGTPVKDAQRTKTHAGTRRAIVVVWGTWAIPERTAETTRWFRELVDGIDGADTRDVRPLF